MITGASVTNVVEIPGLEDLWSETTGDPHICVAVLDGPVDLSHPSLSSADLTALETLTLGAVDQGPATKHGTHVASVIFGQHDGPIKGIAPHCRGLIAPVFRDASEGAIAPCSQLDLARAITTAVQEGAHIINISGGELSPSGTAHPLLADAVRNCAENDVLIVAAAGNEACDCLHIPGALPSVLAVGAMDSGGAPLEFSNWGENYQNQGILALGENILGASPGGGTIANTGTSYATPIVSGIAALLLSIQLKYGLEPIPFAVRKAILASADRHDGLLETERRYLLAGRLDIKGGLSEITRGGMGTMPELNEAQEHDHSQVPEEAGIKIDSGQTPPAEARAEEAETNVAGESESPLPPYATTALRTLKSDVPVVENAADPNRVNPSDCTCGGGSSCTCGATRKETLVYFVGTLNYDLVNETNRDSILQRMDDPANPNDPAQLLDYLMKNPSDAATIIWTAKQDATSVYAIHPVGPFASEGYELLRQFLREQVNGEIERVSVAGRTAGQIMLMSGQVVPVIWPEIRCMYSWDTKTLAGTVAGAAPSDGAKAQEKDAYDQKLKAIADFLERIYYETALLGQDPRERAKLFVVSDALNAGTVIRSALEDGIQLASIDVERSKICRPESECYDVMLTFFDPDKRLERAKKVYRIPVDVSGPCPVMLGPVKSWPEW